MRELSNFSYWQVAASLAFAQHVLSTGGHRTAARKQSASFYGRRAVCAGLAKPSLATFPLLREDGRNMLKKGLLQLY
jgi:hypothetical protein